VYGIKKSKHLSLIF